MKSTIYAQVCQCGRPDCPGTFAANKSRRYANPECSEYARKQLENIRAAGYRSHKKKTDGPRKVPTAAYIQSSAGVRDGQTRKPSAKYVEFLAAMKARGTSEYRS